MDFAQERLINSSGREVFVTADENEEGEQEMGLSPEGQLQAYCVAASNAVITGSDEPPATKVGSDELLLSSGAFFYDVRWLLELQQSSSVLAMQDFLVLAKMFVASVALFSVTRASELLRCDSLAFEATQAVECLDASDSTVHWQYEQQLQQLPSSLVESHCKPRIDLTALDNSFIALIGANQTLFIVFMCLRHIAYWNKARIPQLLRDHSLKVAFGFTFGLGTI